jgi:hypothetical protein
MRTVPVQKTTVDAETGEVRSTETVKFGLMPPKPGVCQECAVAHAPQDPHNAQSMYYQYAFYGEHKRWPTWKDAIAHCSDDLKTKWEAALRERGAWTEPK